MSDYFQENIRLPPKWIHLNVNKRECNTFIPTAVDISICQCGRRKIDHGDFMKVNHNHEKKWSPLLHTTTFPTDAYGTILFEGEHHSNKAHYVRMSYDIHPEVAMNLMRYVWGLPMPKLIISIHGGSLNFDISTRLGKSFQHGLVKVALETSAWIFSTGLNSGIGKHLGTALNNRWSGGYRRRHVVSIGIAPWGMCEHQMELIGRNTEKIYSPMEIHKTNMIHLNPRHSNFLLVDNGSIGRFGGETFLRRRLEKCITAYPISQSGYCAHCTIPMVLIIMEGGCHTLRIISEYLYDERPTPIILFTGTGKATDLVAWMLKRFQTVEELQDSREEVKYKIERHLDGQVSYEVFQELSQIYKRKHLLTVYNGNSASEEELDTVILSSIFRSQLTSPLEQLELTLVWDRVDLAQNEVFVCGREWNRVHLEEAMMEALVSNRLEFVELLMEHGINMKTFLTMTRLEKLYNAAEHLNLIGSLLMEISDIRKVTKCKHKIKFYDGHLSLPGISAALIQMGVYRPEYFQMKARNIGEVSGTLNKNEEGIQEHIFARPFDDLFIWAVLTMRQELAKLFWCHGQGALAKALVAAMLNKCLAKEIAKMNLSLMLEFDTYREEWNKLSFTLLDLCYRQDFDIARQLLTMELKHWSKENCLSLAMKADHKTLLSHPCCQILVADLWFGALNVKSNSIFKIILAALFPPFAYFLQYKSKEELKVYRHEKNGKMGKGHDTYADEEDTLRKNDQEHRLVDSESMRTFQPGKSTESIYSKLKSRYNFRHGKNFSDDAKNWNSAMTPPEIKKGERIQIKVEDYSLPTKYPEYPESINQDNRDAPQQLDSEHKDAKTYGYARDQLKPGAKLEEFEKFSEFVTTQQSLTAFEKLIESQKAPVSNFIRRVCGYLAFLLCFWYVILFQQDSKSIGWAEIYVLSTVFTHILECIKEFANVEGFTFSKKMAEMRENKWRLADFSCCLFVLSGAFLRLKEEYFQYTLTIYRASSIYWNLRIYKYLAVHRFIGPKLLMVTRMFGHMAYFAMIILVVIFTFAVARESIRHPTTDPTWNDVKPSFLEPYVMMFGEVDTLDEVLNIDCLDNVLSSSPKCPLGSGLIPLYWVVYMMISNLLIVNVLIAVFNGIYAEIDANSVEIWMSQRVVVVTEFLKKSLLPPPFIIFSHLTLLVKFICGKCNRCFRNQELLDQNEDDDQILLVKGNNHNIKTFLDPTEQEIVFYFEEESVDLLRHNILLTTDKESKPLFGASLYGNTETAYHAGMAFDKSASLQELKNKLTEIYAEIESQRQRIEKLIEYWEIEAAYQKNKEAKESDDEDDDTSSSDSSTPQNDTPS